MTKFIEEELQEYTWLPKVINSKNDFITIECPEHGFYYKTIYDIIRGDKQCPRCSFLQPSRMVGILLDAQKTIEQDISWLSFWANNRDDQTYLNSKALYFRILLTHKESGFIFQKIGIIEDSELSFDEQWCQYKWRNFTIEPIDKIECTLLEAHTIEVLFQKNNSHLKITVPDSFKFNTNKTYEWDSIWQAKSKTIKPLREAYQNRQKDKCAMCGNLIKDPTLDHTHVKKVKGTGLIRNVLCSQCNTFLARIENNASRHSIQVCDLPEILRNTATHLEEEKNVIHPTEQPKRKKVGKREWNRVRKHYFNVYPNRRTLPKQPTYVTDNWLQMLDEVNNYLKEKGK